MRSKESWSIDEDISKWLKEYNIDSEFKSVSDHVNAILRKEKDKGDDPYEKLSDIEYQVTQLEKEKQITLDQIHVKFEDGNKKEREKAQRILKEQKERHERMLTRLIFCHERLHDLNLYEEFQECTSEEDFKKLARKTIEITMKEGRPLSDGIGIFDLKNLLHHKDKIESMLIIKSPKEE